MAEINPTYLAKDTMKQVRSMFLQDPQLPSVQLQQSLGPSSYAALKEEILSLPYKKECDPLLHSFKSAKPPKRLLALLQSNELFSFLAAVTGEDVLSLSPSVLCIGWKDYTLINDKAVEKPGIDVILDFSDDWDDAWGGSIVYAPGTGDVTRIAPSGNTLIIVERKSGVNRFVQYINHHAGKKTRCFVIATV